MSSVTHRTTLGNVPWMRKSVREKIAKGHLERTKKGRCAVRVIGNRRGKILQRQSPPALSEGILRA